MFHISLKNLILSRLGFYEFINLGDIILYTRLIQENNFYLFRILVFYRQLQVCVSDKHYYTIKAISLDFRTYIL